MTSHQQHLMQARGPNVLPVDGEAYLLPDFLPPAEAAHHFDELRTAVPWQQETAKLFGRETPLPRLTSWYGRVAYRYSGLVHEARPWPPLLDELGDKVAEVAFRPNGVLLNLYRDGQDSVSFHTDDEPIFGPCPVIASLSLGAARRFIFRHNADRGPKVELVLGSGSLLIMAGETQKRWQHAVPKTTKAEGEVGPRINLTFRRIVETATEPGRA